MLSLSVYIGKYQPMSYREKNWAEKRGENVREKGRKDKEKGTKGE